MGNIGKSATARAIQILSAVPFLHVSVDAFLDMLPLAMLAHPDGFRFESTVKDGLLRFASAPARSPLARCAARDARSPRWPPKATTSSSTMSCSAKASSGLSRSALGVRQPLRRPIRAARPARTAGVGAGVRQLGLAKRQFNRVHRHISYDLEVDTAASSPVGCATTICRALGIEGGR